jgi:hypothetical protein
MTNKEKIAVLIAEAYPGSKVIVREANRGYWRDYEGSARWIATVIFADGRRRNVCWPGASMQLTVKLVKKFLPCDNNVGELGAILKDNAQEVLDRLQKKL